MSMYRSSNSFALVSSGLGCLPSAVLSAASPSFETPEASAPAGAVVSWG
eukprot:CAMPEP_0176121898 /NCGR_PEP_ID=MMETSP0120_2-20121206/61374_1 /TAXON_ID=160619 /ORGANISM="Kryptoperidinium foliaceum, Strain CCMP 1326" /LENGTH=48 /DNA_ID= /DNA_START= /DNA_END= /DNA_ORIENTATION=